MEKQKIFILASVTVTNMYFIFPLVLLGCLRTAISMCCRDSSLNESSLIPLLHFKEKSYYFGRFDATYLEADHFCRMIHMELVRVESSEENQKLYQFHQEVGSRNPQYWTAGSKLLDSKTWIWMTTQEVIKYFNWGPQQPDNPTTELCLELVSGSEKGLTFNDRGCEDKLHFICEKKINRYPDIPSLPETNINERNYKIIKVKQTQPNASHMCKQHGMELVTIESKNENDFLVKLIRESGSVGLGDSYWTSGNIHSDETWRWWNNEPFSYTNWLNHYRGGNKNCMHLDTNGFWIDSSCQNSYYIICEIKNNPR